MALPSFLTRNKPDTPAPASSDALVQQARTRARRRLIGSAVLLGIGIIAFPLLFETQPRPIKVDIPIEIPARTGAAAQVVAPKAQRTAEVGAAPAAASSSAGKAPVVTAPAVATPTAPVPRPASAPAVVQAKKPEVKAPEPKVTVAKAPEVKAPEAQAATAIPAATPAAKPADAPLRHVVQVGAFSEAQAARDARLKVEKLGIKTYTQEVNTPDGKRTRVRIGPFESADEANKALARIKAAGLPGAVLTL